MTTVAGIHLGPDTHANRPAATGPTAGSLYYCSDHDLVYITDGSSWSTWADVGGGGGSYAAAVVPPASPGANDDEFDGENGVGTPPGWTLISVTGSQTITESKDVLSVAYSSQTSGDFNGIGKSVSISTGQAVSTALKTLNRVNFDLAGVGFSNGTSTSSSSIAAMQYTASTRLTVWTGTLTNMTEVDSDTVNRSSFISPLYLKVNYDSANTFTSSVSPDGVSWTVFDSARAFTLTPSHICLFWSTAGGGAGNIASFDFIRIA